MRRDKLLNALRKIYRTNFCFQSWFTLCNRQDSYWNSDADAYADTDAGFSKRPIQKLHSLFYFKLFIITPPNYHFNDTFETTLRYTLVVEWNYSVDHETAQKRSRATVTSWRFWWHLLTALPFRNCPKELYLRYFMGPRSDSHYRYFCFAELDLN